MRPRRQMSEPMGWRLVGLALCLGGTYTMWLAYSRPFSAAEFGHGHAAWQLSVGLRPHVHFFADQPPGLWQLLAPLHGLVHSGEQFLLWARRLSLLVALGQLWLLWRLARPRFGAGVALLAPLTAVSVHAWATHAAAIRPESVSWTLYLTALWLVDTHDTKHPRLRVGLAGSCLVAAGWVAPWVMICGSAGLVLLTRSRRRALPDSIFALVSGAAITAGALVGHLWGQGALGLLYDL